MKFPMKILIVEDDRATLDLMDHILVKSGFETVPVSSVGNAKSVLAQGANFGLIISDLMMPEEDGFELLKYRKGIEALRNIPVLICSSLSDKDAVMKCISLGASDYMVKPIQPESLVAKVRRLARGRAQTILVVDDEKTVRNILEATLKRFGFDVATVASAKDALAYMENNPVGMVISDIMMPDMDGLELLKRIKEKNPTLPVYLLTGMSAKYSEIDLRKAGAEGLIAKPFNNMDILNMIRPRLTTPRNP